MKKSKKRKVIKTITMINLRIDDLRGWLTDPVIDYEWVELTTKTLLESWSYLRQALPAAEYSKIIDEDFCRAVDSLHFNSVFIPAFPDCEKSVNDVLVCLSKMDAPAPVPRLLSAPLLRKEYKRQTGRQLCGMVDRFDLFRTKISGFSSSFAFSVHRN